MADAKQRPDGTPDQKPQNQTGANKGPIKAPQRDGHSVRGEDLPRGSEGDVRRASQNR
ncbi:hypothetical protein FHS61_001755 [Altererythrobacter atlanticus]|uniref:Uncharacterized protein n=1 Tax=Croceibacterium atlanticum TaxID=1267766 RepID=A0A0F7KKY7_9SPHN|nr:hypothetical protein [Croceibacterium atlanticum]AKH41228.1 hypothetical protein WYH_00162 [Croceibacterium atlanticum]MBB5732746.1 hypothetical protein [Croceibacterium atlanticum]